jgi:hypothetical protein
MHHHHTPVADTGQRQPEIKWKKKVIYGWSPTITPWPPILATKKKSTVSS